MSNTLLNPPFIHPTAVVERDVSISEGCKVWHFCHVRSGVVLEANVSLGKDVFVDEGVRIGKGSRVQNGVSVYKGVEIDTWCFVGPHVIFTNDLTPRAGNLKWDVIRTILKPGASIGAGSVIRCGITLGEFSLVGAGAIVTKDVHPFHVATGFPAELTKMVCACGRTLFPLRTEQSKLISDCCESVMDPELFTIARAKLKI